MPLELTETPVGKYGKSTDIRHILDKEDEQILTTADKDHIVILDVPGRPRDMPQLAAELGRWKLDGHDVNLPIGGSEGLLPTCRTMMEQGWSLSALTLPHPLVRALIVESLYRAWSITTDRLCHRE